MFPRSFEPTASSVISGVSLFLSPKLVIINESPGSDGNERNTASGQRGSRVCTRWWSHPRATACQSGIPDVTPLTRQERWLFPHVSNGMHEMQKWATLFFRARQNPYAVRSKDFLNWQKSWKSMLDCKRRTIRRKGVRQLSLCIQQWWLWSEQNGLLVEHLTFTKLVRGGCHHSL
jgi:hypothetical protein